MSNRKHHFPIATMEVGETFTMERALRTTFYNAVAEYNADINVASRRFKTRREGPIRVRVERIK